METPGFEPGASRMRSERSTTELRPPLSHFPLLPLLHREANEHTNMTTTGNCTLVTGYISMCCIMTSSSS